MSTPSRPALAAACVIVVASVALALALSACWERCAHEQGPARNGAVIEQIRARR